MTENTEIIDTNVNTNTITNTITSGNNTTTTHTLVRNKEMENLFNQDGSGDSTVLINPRLNLRKLVNDQFEDDSKESKEGEDVRISRFNGQKVVLYNMGPEDEYVEAISSEYSKFCHPNFNLVYGYRKDHDSEDLLIAREYVNGQNYYTLANYECLGDRLIGFYKCLSLIEYVHSFQSFLRILKPEKFILGDGLTHVKLVDCIKHDNRYLTKIQISDNVERSMRYIHPNFYKEDLTDNSFERSVDYQTVKQADLWSVGCMLYFAITRKDPWSKYNSKEQILKAFNSGKEFWTDADFEKDDNGAPVEKELFTWFMKCMDADANKRWDDELTKFREALEKRENIHNYITPRILSSNCKV